jgi:hypothetical protein
MTFCCYKFDSKEQFRSLAAAEGLIVLDEDGNESLITGGHGWALDEIGVITEGGAWDPETGEVITPPTVIPGHHVNFMGEPPESFDPFLVVVNSASRIFLGGPTQAPSTDILEEIAA